MVALIMIRLRNDEGLLRLEPEPVTLTTVVLFWNDTFDLFPCNDVQPAGSVIDIIIIMCNKV